MKELYGLSPAQMAEVYCAYVYEDCLDEIRTRLYDGTYGEEMRKKGIPELTVDEINEAAKWLQKNILAYTHWTDGGEDAIDYVLAKRPPKAEPKPKPDTLFGLTKAQMDTVYEHQLRHQLRQDIIDVFWATHEFDEDAEEYKNPLTEEEIERAVNYSVWSLPDHAQYSTIANESICKVLDERKPKEPPKDLLNDTLKMIGLETMQRFRIDDVEFKDQTLCIDSFGDVHKIITEATNVFYEEGDEIEHDYLTLGRILTQYPDKVIPIGKV